MATVNDLEALEVFNGFSSEQKKKIAAICQKKKLKKGDDVYLSRYRASRLFVVTSGRVDLQALDEDKRVGLSLGTLSQGQLFGGASILKLQAYTITAVCLTDAELLVIESDDLFEAIAGDYELGYRIMKKVAEVYLARYETAKKQLYDMVNTPQVVITARSG